MSSLSLHEIAIAVVTKYPQSHYEMAMAFCRQTCPTFLTKNNVMDNDRLIKVGRSLENLVHLYGGKNNNNDTTTTTTTNQTEIFDASIQQLVDECELLASGKVKVPRVRFGKTELQMPILTLGCMRFQQAWGPRVSHMNLVSSDCQDNLFRILHRAVCDYGMVHIETARGYGSSELQLGVALQQLFTMYPANVIQRSDLIIQTKVGACANPNEFRATLEKSFELLQLDYIDLFSFHGLNMPYHYDWVFGKNNATTNTTTAAQEETCYSVIQEYVQAGKIRHVGFSSHADQALIRKFIDTNVFSYVNLHHHYFGSYTTTGVGLNGTGNLENIRLCQAKDMGVFIISAYDKGGKVYEPSNKLRSLCLPDMEPIAFSTAWMWTHEKHASSSPPIHTAVVGAARPADLDQGAVVAYQMSQDPDGIWRKVQAVMARLEQAKVDALGQEWVHTWHMGLPKSNVSTYAVEHNQIIWCYNVLQAFGMYEFAKNRYGSLEGNRDKWDASLSIPENIAKIGSWGYVPGLSLDPQQDYTDDFVNIPASNLEKIKEAEAFVHKWCHTKKKGEKVDEELVVPEEWKTAYFMKPWVDFPDRPAST